MSPPKPLAKKQSAFYDAQITPQERMAAYQALSPAAKNALKKTSYRPGQIPTMAQMDAVMAALTNQVQKELVKACGNALVKRDLASVNDLLGAVKRGDAVGIPPDDKSMDIASAVVRLIATEWEFKAYSRFRTSPTSENYARCWGARKLLDTLGVEGSTVYPVNPWPKCNVKPPLKPGPYTVVSGDWLSKIAERYYGAANLWDAIFESNKYDGHPDRITPGTKLTIL